MRSTDRDIRETRARRPAGQPLLAGTDSPRAVTPGREHAGFLARVWFPCSCAIRRAVLGRSGWDYLKQYTGSDAYWDNMIAAQRECTPEPPR
jgi:hypothetical protein